MRAFLEKFGCLSTIILVVGIVILCNKVDSLNYITHEPIAYCRKFPSGKHTDKAIGKIVYNLDNVEGYYNKRFGSQKKLAAFIQPLSYSPQKEKLEEFNRRQYEIAIKYARSIVFTADFDWKYIENYVEDKYKPEIAAIRADLEKRWKREASAWAIVCNAKLSLPSEEQRLLQQYLDYYPNSRHALQAYEWLVEVMGEEMDDLEDELSATRR